MQDMEMFQKVTDTTRHILEFFEQLLLNLTSGNKNIVQQEDILDLISHVKRGGNVENILVPAEDQEYFAELLRNNRTSFVACEVTNPETKEPQTMFLFKNTDSHTVQVALDDYRRHLDGRCHELDDVTFFEANERKGYVSVDGLTQAELIVFRQEAEKYNMDYVVLDSSKKDGTFMICANNEKYLNRALNDTLYMTSGPDGREYKAKVQEFGKTQRDFYEEAKTLAKSKEPSYIIDAEHPNQIIAISNGGYSVHSMKIEVEQNAMGETIRTPVEFRHRSSKKVDADILSEVRQMEHPVLVSSKDVKNLIPFIVGVNNQGVLEVTDRFADTDYLKGIRDDLRERKAVVVRLPKHEKDVLLEPGKLRTYTNLPAYVVKAIKDANIDGVYVGGRDVAYLPEKEDLVKAILQEKLYKGMSPLRQIEEDIAYRDHGRGRLKDLSPEETYYVVDASAPARQRLTISPIGYDFTVGQNEMYHKPAGSPDYEESVVNFIQQMETPIILTKEEFESDSIELVVGKKLFDIPDNMAIQYIMNMDANEREALEKYVEMSKEQLSDETLTQTQQEVLERRETLKINKEEPSMERTREARERKVTRETREREDNEQER